MKNQKEKKYPAKCIQKKKKKKIFFNKKFVYLYQLKGDDIVLQVGEDITSSAMSVAEQDRTEQNR